VEFTVDLIEAKGIGAPRAESRDFLMAMGIAGSLHEATRRATAALAEWLMAESNLEFNVVAKVRKDRIAASEQ
jgi:hypothetical protein